MKSFLAWSTGWLNSLLAVGLLGAVATAPSARAAERPIPAGAYNPADETVEFFEAVESGRIEAKMIQINAHEARLLVKNTTQRPLNVKLPEVFASAPVVAQFGGGGGLGGGGGFGGGGGGGQTTGGGGGLGGGGGQFNVPAERLGQVKLATVCLEHGKPEPRAAIPYKMIPLSQFDDRPELAELLKLFASGHFSQEAAQAAAWHIANGLSWEELAAKRIRRANGATYPYFQRRALAEAVRLVAAARRNAELAADSHQPEYTGRDAPIRVPRR